MDDPKIAGVIHLAPSDAEKPEFEIIRRDGFRRVEEACAHGKFVLDERWAQVTCGKCGERVDPFCALMRYAENYQAIVRHHERMVESETRLHKEELKRLARLRGASDEERGEIARLLGWGFKGDVNDLREAASRIGRAIGGRVRARRNS